MTKFLNTSTDTTLGGNSPSDELVASQKAVKTYVDNHSGGSYNAGTGIDITGSTISVTAPTLTNAATGSSALSIIGNGTNQTYAVNIGYNSSVSNYSGVAYGYNATVAGEYGIAIGSGSSASSSACISIGSSAGASSTPAWYQTCIGYNSAASATGAYQFGAATNSEAGTVCFALTTTGLSWTNYKLLDSDGTIPEARLASTTGASQGQVLTLDSSLNAVWANAGGGSYTAGDGINITNDVISVGDIDCGVMS